MSTAEAAVLALKIFGGSTALFVLLWALDTLIASSNRNKPL